MRLTVLGSAGSYPAPGRACSSYLLEAEGRRLLLDCGNGSLGTLLGLLDVADVDYLVLSHAHADHLADAYAAYIARRYHPAGPCPPLPVLAPAGVADRLAGLAGADGAALASSLPVREVADRQTLEAGPFHLDFRRVEHPVPTLGVRVRAGASVLAYSADTAPCDAVVELARDADVFLCEATWSGESRAPGLHCTGAEAGALAARAGAQRLVITHVAHPDDPAEVAAQAAERYGAAVVAAQDGQRHAF